MHELAQLVLTLSFLWVKIIFLDMIEQYENLIFKRYCDFLMKRITEKEFIFD